ncbi:MAG TPA: response regulator [Gemmataceae bacterium]|jgi:CheY-like chemotaxis protein|nr:response regulator [Gemmataceae bacterium]
MIQKRLMILLAEDDDGHANLVQRNLKRAGFINEVVRVRDGQEALDYVRGEGAFIGRVTDASLLLLLDINMPRVDGIGVLQALKSDPATAQVPVIMLTTTDDAREVERCYQLGCSVYITKPVQYQDFVDALTRLGMFLEIIKVPNAKK